MSIDQIRKLIEETKGKVFTITFRKKDNSLREMNCRLDVKKYLRGGSDSTAHIDKYMSVFDMKAQDYRKINLETATQLVFGGQTLTLS